MLIMGVCFLLYYSSSSTVLVYASNQLFFTSRLSSKIYTVSSHLASVGVGQSLALGEVTLAGTTNKTSALEIRDMAVSSTSLQTLPGESSSWTILK